MLLSRFKINGPNRGKSTGASQQGQVNRGKFLNWLLRQKKIPEPPPWPAPKGHATPAKKSRLCGKKRPKSGKITLKITTKRERMYFLEIF
jgi:hypothetical protein